MSRGYIPMLTKPLAAVGSLRNSFAHKLNFALTADTKTALYETFDRDARQIIQESYQRTRKANDEKRPRKLSQLDPKEQFALYASSIRNMLAIGYKQQTGSYPE